MIGPRTGRIGAHQNAVTICKYGGLSDSGSLRPCLSSSGRPVSEGPVRSASMRCGPAKSADFLAATARVGRPLPRTARGIFFPSRPPVGEGGREGWTVAPPVRLMARFPEVVVGTARWSEMVTKAHVWAVSALGMKAKREHRVRPCWRVVEVLDAARTLGNSGRGLVPDAAREADIGDDAAQDAPAPPDQAVAHGLRSSFPGLGGGGDAPPARGERGGAGARGPDKVEAAYDARSDLFELRRRLMHDWAAISRPLLEAEPRFRRVRELRRRALPGRRPGRADPARRHGC